MSSGCGSSTDASCWAARKMRLSFINACSSARVELGRPITNGIIMCGKTTTSRNGTMGRVRTLPTETPGTLSGLLDQRDRLVLRQNDFAGDCHLADLLLIRDLIHQIEHEIFNDHAQPARADLPFERRLRDG